MNIEDGLALLRQAAPDKMVAIHADYMMFPAKKQPDNNPHTSFIAFIHMDKDTLLAGNGRTLEGAVMDVLGKLNQRQ